MTYEQRRYKRMRAMVLILASEDLNTNCSFEKSSAHNLEYAYYLIVLKNDSTSDKQILRNV